jgi:hypothetical protein
MISIGEEVEMVNGYTVVSTEINFQKQEPMIKIKDGKGQTKDKGVFFRS